MWRDDQGATLVHENGAEKLALRWLRGYVQDSTPRIEGPLVAFLSTSAGPGTVVGTFGGYNADGTAYPPESGIAWGIADAREDLQMGDNGELVVASPLATGTYTVPIYAEVNSTLSQLHELTLYVD